jgi:hypothetical protein
MAVEMFSRRGGDSMRPAIAGSSTVSLLDRLNQPQIEPVNSTRPQEDCVTFDFRTRTRRQFR